MSESVEAKISYTPDDFIRHAKFMQSRSFSAKYSAFFAVGIIFLILGFVYLLNPAKFLTTFTKSQNALVIIIPVLLIIAWHFLRRKSPQFFLKRSIEKQIKSSPALSEPQFVSFDEEGLSAENQFRSGQIKWEAIIETVETKDDFFFFTTDKFAQFIPKRFFSNQQIDRIHELIKRNG